MDAKKKLRLSSSDQHKHQMHLCRRNTFFGDVSRTLRQSGIRQAGYNILRSEGVQHLNRRLVLRLVSGCRKFHWDADSWKTFLDTVFARREMVWADRHVWPHAFSLYHLLTRRGLDKHCAANLMVDICITPRVKAFRKQPRKKRCPLGGFMISV